MGICTIHGNFHNQTFYFKKIVEDFESWKIHCYASVK